MMDGTDSGLHISTYRADCGEVMGAYESGSGLLHDAFVQMLGIEPGAVDIERIPNVGIVNLIGVFFLNTGADGIKTFVGLLCIENHNISGEMGVQCVGDPVYGDPGVCAEIGNVDSCMDSCICATTAGDMDFVAYDTGSGFFQCLGYGDGVLLHLPAMVGGAVIF